MKDRSSTTRRATSTFAVLAMSLTLTGCMSNPVEDAAEEFSDNVAEKGAEEIVEQASDGEVQMDLGEMPEDFPEEVPLVSTDVTQGMTVNNEQGQGTMVIVSDSRGVSEVGQQVQDDFADWEEIASTDMGEMITGQYKQDGLTVIVGVTEDGASEGSAVSYTVIATDQ